MTQRVNSSLTPEEQAEVMHIQERVIELFGDRDAAVAAGDSARADALRGEIDDLLREREDIQNVGWRARQVRRRRAAQSTAGLRCRTAKP